jgi:hypothetical protein
MPEDPFKNIPDVNFAVKDPKLIESSIITLYEQLRSAYEGAPFVLYPGNPIRLFLTCIAALITEQRVIIDLAAKQNC